MEISEVENVIKCIDVNKICGVYEIYAEHLNHYDKRIVPLLAMCITVFLQGCLPSSLLYVALVPIIKKINVATSTAKTIIDLLH